MCLVIKNGEIKKSCCKCGGLCKREQQWREKMSSISWGAESVDLTVFLCGAQPLQYQTALINSVAYYEESNHLRPR